MTVGVTKCRQFYRMRSSFSKARIARCQRRCPLFAHRVGSCNSSVGFGAFYRSIWNSTSSIRSSHSPTTWAREHSRRRPFGRKSCAMTRMAPPVNSTAGSSLVAASWRAWLGAAQPSGRCSKVSIKSHNPLVPYDKNGVGLYN